MESKGFIDQDPNALRLTVVEGDLERSQFTLMKGGLSVICGIRVNATVIGASHIVTFTTSSFSLNEIFACVEVPSVASWPLSQLTERSLVRELPGMVYCFTAESIPWQGHEPCKLREIVAAANGVSDGNIGIVQEFPQGDLPSVPMTIIVGTPESQENGVSIWTAHAYPGKGVVVSHSTLLFT